MSDFIVDSDKMEQIVTKLEKIQDAMDDSYYKLSMLISEIETEKEWEGQAQKEFLAFMRLLQMYHKEFTSQRVENCIEGAEKAINSFLDKMSRFETENEKFVKMKGIS
ncbi:MAG: hypothetical protein U0K68_01910 [Agathobacter sp.]|nr:hypothetical protein [Agathobacter sp.]